jgi:hypothetical protein
MDDTEREKEKEKEKHDCGTDVEDEEEDEEGNKRVVVLGPQVPLKEQLELDKVRICLRQCLNNSMARAAFISSCRIGRILTSSSHPFLNN